MRSIRHWNAGYLANRLAKALSCRSQNGRQPNLADAAIQFLDGWLTRQDVMLEYGSGHSTLWFARRVKQIISVESNPEWYNIVKVETSICDNVQVHLIDAQNNPVPIAHVSWDYVNFIKRFDKESFDLILNDGYARPLVAKLAVDYLKESGILIWDDWGHSYPIKSSVTPGVLRPGDSVDLLVEEFVDYVSTWRTVTFDDGIHTSALFIKPV